MARPGRKKTAWKRNPRYRGLRPWPKGVSGNPRGRPKGSRNRARASLPVEKLRQLMEDKRVPAAVQLKAAEFMIKIAVGMVVNWDDDE